MSLRLMAGIAIHLLTASGAVVGLLALDFATDKNWPAVFLCLGLALVIDGIDGPLARHYEVDVHLPRFSGIRLDLVVDYLNYCLVPAFIILQAPLMSGYKATGTAGFILLTSLFHFADRKSKTKDGYFVGFPAVWNIVIFYIMVFDLSGSGVMAIVLVLGFLTFVPVKWVHPLRVVRLRGVTILVVLLWSAVALYTVQTGFPGHVVVKAIFIFVAMYFLILGLCRKTEE